LRYIKGTSDTALCYGGSESTVKGYVDSDFANDLEKRKSTTCYMFKIAGGAMSWVSKLQTVVTDVTILFHSFTHIYLMFCPCFIYKMS
jgi:hypothetical protein